MDLKTLEGLSLSTMRGAKRDEDSAGRLDLWHQLDDDTLPFDEAAVDPALSVEGRRSPFEPKSPFSTDYLQEGPSSEDDSSNSQTETNHQPPKRIQESLHNLHRHRAGISSLRQRRGITRRRRRRYALRRAIDAAWSDLMFKKRPHRRSRKQQLGHNNNMILPHNSRSQSSTAGYKSKFPRQGSLDDVGSDGSISFGSQSDSESQSESDTDESKELLFLGDDDPNDSFSQSKLPGKSDGDEVEIGNDADASDESGYFSFGLEAFGPIRSRLLDSRLLCHFRPNEDSRSLSRNVPKIEKKVFSQEEVKSAQLPQFAMDINSFLRLDSFKNRVSLATTSVNETLEGFWAGQGRKSHPKHRDGVIDSSSTTSTCKNLSDDDTLVHDIPKLVNFVTCSGFTS